METLPATGLSVLSPDSRNLLMVKDSVAALLREEIITGRLAPGERIIEGKVAKKLKLAQTSIREAINTLSVERFVNKGSGRSASVTLLTASDVAQIYQLRAVLEGLAARLIAERQPDLSDLDQLIANMRSTVECRNVRAFYDRDLRFHLLICEKSGNRYLEQDLRQLMVPLFAFVILRIHGKDDSADTFERSIEQHRQMLQAIRSGKPFFAEQQVRNTISKFFSSTHGLLQNDEGSLPASGR